MNIAFIRKWLIAMQQGVFGSPGKWQKLTFQTKKNFLCACKNWVSVWNNSVVRLGSYWLDFWSVVKNIFFTRQHNKRSDLPKEFSLLPQQFYNNFHKALSSKLSNSERFLYSKFHQQYDVAEIYFLMGIAWNSTMVKIRTREGKLNRKTIYHGTGDDIAGYKQERTEPRHKKNVAFSVFLLRSR